MSQRPNGPEIDELHDYVMEAIGDYIDFEYSFDNNEMDGNADEGDNLEEITLWNNLPYDFEVTIERCYKQHEDGHDMNYQGSYIEGDYDSYVSWLKVKWPDAYEKAIASWQLDYNDRITVEDKAVPAVLLGRRTENGSETDVS